MARLSPAARRLVLEVYAEIRAEWAYATDVMARALRAHRELPSGDRRAVAEAVYGLLRMHRRLGAIVDEAIGCAGLRPNDLPAYLRDELALLVHEIRADGLPVEAANAEARRLLGPACRVDLALATDDDAGLGKTGGADRDALRLSYPTWMVERLVVDLGRDAALAICDAMNRRAPLCIRANTVKTSREDLARRLAEEGVVARPAPLSSAGLVLQTRVNAFGLAAFREGLFEVMDEGSDLAAELVAPPPAGRVCDACAGAGGKTLAIAAALGGKGRVLALDVAGRKLEELRRRARRAGLTNVTARAIEGGRLPADAKLASFDRVLVDAPCSGLGTLRRNPEARWRLSPRDVDAFPARQIALLVEYAPLVAPGGRLVYVTCTVLAAENDRVVDRFLAERDGFVRMPVKEIWGRERAERLGDGLSLRLFPHVHDTDGFFAAVLRREA